MRKGLVLLLSSFMITGVIYSCGGGGSSAPPASSNPMITGTAASGAGHVRRPIEIGDGNGKHGGGETDDIGNFRIPSAGLTPPFLLRVITSAPTKTLYSVSADLSTAPTINITPLTDLIIRSWYKVKSVNIDTAFTNNPVLDANKPPSPESVSLVHTLIKNMVQLWLDKNGVTSTDFNLISTPFTAGTITIPATGIDKVLEQAWINASAGTILLSDGTTTQNSTLSTFLTSLTASTTTYSISMGTYVESGYNDDSSILVNPDEEAALAAITSVVTSLSSTINAKGAALQESDLLPYIDPGLLKDGLNQAHVAAKLVADNKGKTVAFLVEGIRELDTTVNPNRAVVGVNGMGRTIFKKIGGSWLISGNDRIAALELSVNMRNQEGNSCPTCSGIALSVKVQAPQGMISNVTITGWSLWPSPTIIPAGNPVSYPTVTLASFFLSSGSLAQAPPKDTPFTVTLVSSGSGTVTYEMRSNAYTTEPIYITSITGTTLAAANLGSSRTVTWTEPKTFALQKYGRRLQYQLFTNTDTCTDYGTAGVESGTITLPSACGLNPINQVTLGIGIHGLNGEATNASWVFK